MTKIGTWNLQNLFRPGGDSGSPSDEDAYTAKLEALARTITGLDPDVLAIQEVGDPDALRDLTTRLEGRIYRGRRELIDHLLVSHALPDSVTAVTTGRIELPSITDNPVAQRNHPGSDHRPVIATLSP